MQQEKNYPFIFWSSEVARKKMQDILPVVLLFFLVLFFHAMSEGSFLTPRNLSNLSRQISIQLILAVGMTIVILTGGIDLSIGSLLAMSGMITAISQFLWGWDQWGAKGALLSTLLALSVGGGCGFLVGFLVSRVKIPPFIVTLGMMVIARGITLVISGAKAIAPIGPELSWVSSGYFSFSVSLIFLLLCFSLSIFSFIQAYQRKEISFLDLIQKITYLLFAVLLGSYTFLGYQGIPMILFIAAACAFLCHWAIENLRYGRFVYAVGGNIEAAILSGVPVQKTLWVTYSLMGVLASLAGVLDVARVNGAVPSAGELAELDAIAAVVIGGTSLQGGLGSLSGTMFGVLVMGILNNGMSLMNLSEHYQKILKGIVIILAVYFDRKNKT